MNSLLDVNRNGQFDSGGIYSKKLNLKLII